MRKWFVISTLLLSVCLIGAGIAQEKSVPAQVAGEWSISLTFSRGTANHTAIIEQNEDTLSGTYKGELTEGSLRGTVKGNAVQFSSRLTYMQSSAPFNYTGTIDGDTMKGTVEMAEYWTATFIAKRKK